ncbi:hypothetical protein RZS08_20665, partial [Arthrospira platensis SPKY1]|nr:hypothetical protein [Arthrospira platensis SPKY1]
MRPFRHQRDITLRHGKGGQRRIGFASLRIVPTEEGVADAGQVALPHDGGGGAGGVEVGVLWHRARAAVGGVGDG